MPRKPGRPRSSRARPRPGDDHASVWSSRSSTTYVDDHTDRSPSTTTKNPVLLVPWDDHSHH